LPHTLSASFLHYSSQDACKPLSQSHISTSGQHHPIRAFHSWHPPPLHQHEKEFSFALPLRQNLHP